MLIYINNLIKTAHILLSKLPLTGCAIFINARILQTADGLSSILTHLSWIMILMKYSWMNILNRRFSYSAGEWLTCGQLHTSLQLLSDGWQTAPFTIITAVV